MPLRAKITVATNKMVSASEDSLKGQLEKAVEEGKVPQAVVFAATGDGAFSVSSSLLSGTLALRPADFGSID